MQRMKVSKEGVSYVDLTPLEIKERVNEEVVYEQKQFTNVKKRKELEIEVAKKVEQFANIKLKNRNWKADKESQELLLHAIILSQAGAPIPTTWPDATGEEVPINSINDLLDISKAILQRTHAITKKATSLKALVNSKNVATKKQVEEIKW